jgi:hypothetical protein
MYEMLLLKGWRPEKLVVGLVTNPENGSGYVPWSALSNVLPLLAGRHPRFGGVMGWEYFNSLPGGRERPWEWAQAMTALLRGHRLLSGAVGGGPTAGASAGTNDVNPLPKTAVAVVDGMTTVRPSANYAAADDDGDGDGLPPSVPVPQDFEYYSDGTGGNDDDK